MKTTAVAFVLCWAVTLSAAERVPWTTSRVVGSPEPPKPYHVKRVYPHLQFDQPVELMQLADTGKMMLLEVTGKLYTFDDDPDCRAADLAIDLQPRVDEFRRAFGFGVHPNFSENRQIFVVYARDPVARPDGTRLSRFEVSSEEPFRVDPKSEEILLTWASGGHNGCAIRFDSEGLLYFSTGDGARPFPPDEYDVSQDLSDLRSTICRINVDRDDGGRAYSIPPDNPFVNTPLGDGKIARPEIWAYGFRNPWRFTIVPGTDQLLCGDVGWELWELVFDVRRGGNYGWSIFEGPQAIRSDVKPGPTPILKPLVSYPHTVGQSVTGGIVYRGKNHPKLQGAYLYGDYVTGLVWGLRHDEEQVTWNPVIAETGLQVITFAESRDNEVLIVSYDGGIFELDKNDAAEKRNDFPRKLSETGLFESTVTLDPAAGVMRYEIAAGAWRDGATSEFVVGVPGTETIKINRQQRSWAYPEGTVFANTLSKDGRRYETQILHFDGMTWQPYSYLWDDQQSDALLVDESGLALDNGSPTATFEIGKRWPIAPRAHCRACHSRQSGGAIGFTLENLGDSQIDHFIEIGILDRRPPKGWNLSKMVDPRDSAAALEQRARSYLAANCAHCHRRGGGGTVPLDLTYSLPPGEINAIDLAPTQGSFGIDDAKVLSPGDPYRSVLFYRMATLGTGHMPKLWSRANDPEGLKLVHDWIASMSPSGDTTRANDGRDHHDIDDPFASTSASLRRFARLLETDDAEQAMVVARSAVAHANVVTSALFERFLPEGERRNRLGENINVDQILAMTGDADRGRARFLDGQGQQCIHCHRIQGSGRSVGPDLDAIAGKRSRQQLLESILDPSKEIDPKHATYLTLIDDGTIVTGLKIDENDVVIVIRSADGKDHRIEKETLESLKIQEQSLMPTGIAAEMTAQELADLLAFLCSLR